MSHTSSANAAIHLEELRPGSNFHVQTRNRCYRVEYTAKDEVQISGHPEYCPVPMIAKVGSTNKGGSVYLPGFVAVGMYLKVQCSDELTFRTTLITDIRVQ